MIVDEIKLYDADILTIQELDNFDEFYKQIFTELGYQVEYYCHPSKRHGCGIVYKKNKYTKVDYDTINYDLDTLCSPSVLTGNIGQLIALRLSDQPNTGFVIGNTHLYWRPSSNYERCRQTIIYANRLLEFRSQLAKDISWISFLNGDFNTTPDDPVYALLTTNEFTQDIVENLAESRLITLQKKDGLEEEEEEKVESDRIIITEDVDTAEKLLAKYNKTKWTSIYSHFGKIGPPELVGLFGEPKFTDYASQFKGTLDYMFVDAPVIIKQLLTPPKEEYLKPSLPNKHFGSDHLCLIADIEFQ
ncbi:Endonuclease/exonuclease/phosphatase [Gilbertella persicaria]|uniref:Endonuclease/exonuclease/phosphatase n=1 Tax=Gilbertella persicaria TaxID=101096 RepID=UPI00221F0F3F|nr:Endonuclease/exonuclease/phosphatase [Gilbertella persicaria]KAI8084277.1 Endonuclease/exonuclease/phosphatase [Gilbertella persicaria]